MTSCSVFSALLQGDILNAMLQSRQISARGSANKIMTTSNLNPWMAQKKPRGGAMCGMLAAVISLACCMPVLGAQSSEPWIGPFERTSQAAPIILPRSESVFLDPIAKRPVHWEALNTFNPAAIVKDGKVMVLYRAEDESGAMKVGGHTSRIGLAESRDGIHFSRRSEPVFFAANDEQMQREWPGGVEDPRIVESEDGLYVLTYTQWNRERFTAAIATSKDLLHWTKYGPLFQDAKEHKYAAMKYKSAGIVTQLDKKKGRLIAARINGSYWMYWGEGAVHLASSPDLIHWTPVEDPSGRLLELLAPRQGYFDSGFPEVGPPPVLNSKGIVLIYNGKNAAGSEGDRSLGVGSYATGEALFDANHPERLIARSEQTILKPSASYETSGQYVAGTTFSEGLVYFQRRWFLYYGCADSRVAVVLSAQEP